MRTVLSSALLAGALALSVIGHASTFTFSTTGSAGGFSGSGVLTTNSTANADGSFTVTGITGPGITGLIAPNTFGAGGALGNNDNELFSATPGQLVDGNGIGFTDVMGNTSFEVDLFSTGPSSYDVYLLDSDGIAETLPVSFSISNVAATPEPASLLLLGTGILGLTARARRRFAKA